MLSDTIHATRATRS